jgi:hypothetical protein
VRLLKRRKGFGFTWWPCKEQRTEEGGGTTKIRYYYNKKNASKQVV